ncbi:MAG: hypothetical protein AAB942_01035 [Patescibacteria group bacterium]
MDTKKIIEKIASGQIKQRSKIYFTSRAVAMIFGLVLVCIGLYYLSTAFSVFWRAGLASMFFSGWLWIFLGVFLFLLYIGENIIHKTAPFATKPLVITVGIIALFVLGFILLGDYTCDHNKGCALREEHRHWIKRQVKPCVFDFEKPFSSESASPMLVKEIRPECSVR